jgi:hypothetical protein
VVERNKYGLARDIPEAVKLAIRQAARFGCVCCGFAIGTYEHIEPEFADAKEHDPDRMTYLCGHCHDKVTRRILSKQSVWNARSHPWCLTHGGPHEAFDIGSSSVSVWLGRNRVTDVPTVLRIVDTTLLRIDRPEAEHGPYRISGQFYDVDGNSLFSIDQNDWIGSPSAWDIQCVGPRIMIRRERRIVALQLCAVPPSGIVIERADFVFQSSRVCIMNGVLSVISPTGNIATATDCTATGDGIGSIFLSVTEHGQFMMGAPLTLTGAYSPPPSLPPEHVIHLGRNAPCFCDSGKKYKKCHGP